MELVIHPLVLPIALPILAGLVCLLLPNGAQKTRSFLAVAAAALTVVCVWPLFADPGARLEAAPWLTLRVDGLSAVILLAVFVVVIPHKIANRSRNCRIQSSSKICTMLLRSACVNGSASFRKIATRSCLSAITQAWVRSFVNLLMAMKTVDAAALTNTFRRRQQPFLSLT